MVVRRLLNLFKPKRENKIINKEDVVSSSRSDFWGTISKIEEHKYVNDDKAKKLYVTAYDQSKDNLIDRHFYYNSVIDYYYGLRDTQEDALEKCIQFCISDIEITPKVLSLMNKDNTFKHYNEESRLVFTPPRFPSFQRLSIIYDRQGKYEEAIKICKMAIEYNLKDGTKTGFEGRINRLKNKLEKRQL